MPTTHRWTKQELEEQYRREKKISARRSLPKIVMLDDDGFRVSAGDVVRFNYGIPPVCVKAKLVQRGKSLIALTPGHNPAECNLRSLRKYVGGWFKHNVEVSHTAHRTGRLQLKRESRVR